MWRRLLHTLGIKNGWNYRKSRSLVIINLILAAMALFASLPRFLSHFQEEPSSLPKAPCIEHPSEGQSLVQRIEGHIQRNMTLSDILSSYDLSQELIHQLVMTSKPIYNLRKLIPGNRFELEKLADGTLQMFRYDVDLEKYLTVTLTGEGYKAELQPFKYESRVEIIQGTIHGSLFQSITELDERDQLALDLSEIFSWDIDFNTELQEEDQFCFVVEKHYLDGNFVKYGKILAANFINRGRLYSGYYFADLSGRGGYYNSEGKALRRDFLKSPLRFSRISSTFSRRRFHPILKSFRPHLGVDYAAPAGTPVVSAGNGRIQYVGWKVGFGRFVQIAHSRELTTMYGHLSGFGRGIRTGATVTQGQVIGYVGSSGLATGAHLDYRVTRRGSFTNPLSIKTQPSEPIKSEYASAFRALRDKWQLELNSRYGAPVVQQALR